MKPEAKLQQEIQKLVLRNFPNAFIMKVHGNMYQKKGVPDLLIIINGITIFIETKIKYNKPSAIQLAVINEIKEAGCYAYVVYSIEEAKEVLKKSGVKKEDKE